MYSNGGIYIPDRKPPMGAMRNPYLKINRGIVLDTMMWEGAGPTVEDLSGYGNPFLLQGTINWQLGKFGSCLQGNGSNFYGVIDDNPLFDFGTGDFTLVIWFNTTNGNEWLFQKGDSRDHNYYRLYIRTSDPYVRFTVAQNGSGLAQTVSMSLDVRDGLWHQAVALRKGDNIYVYIDGILRGSDSGASGVNVSSVSGLYLGAQLHGNFPDPPDGGFIIGKCDMPSIYNRALYAAEILQLAQEPFCGFRWASIEQLAVYYEEVVVGGIMTTNTGYWGAL